MEKFGSGMEKVRSGINIPDPPHCLIPFLVVDGRIRIRKNNNGIGSRRPKNIRIRIHNTYIKSVPWVGRIRML
jgi:hypothetical protein